MVIRKLRLLVMMTVLALPWSFSPAQARYVFQQEHGEEVEKLDPVHHNSDAYYLDFEPFGKVELPRIFLIRDAEGALDLEVFGSTKSALSSGHFQAVSAEDERGKRLDSEIEAAEGDLGLDIFGSTESALDSGHSETVSTEFEHGTYLDAEIEAAVGSHILVDFSITRHLAFAWLTMLIVLFVFLRLAGIYRRGIGRVTEPRGIFQNMMETLVLFVRDEIARPNIGPKADRYVPYLLTAFFFILTSNLLGLIPFAATATSNLMVTAVLAMFTFFITQMGGTKDYWKHIFWPPGIPTMVKPILMPVEVLGLFTKPFALAIRLFANMTAGHLVILSLIGLIFAFTNLFGPGAGYGVAPVSVAFALFIYILELLVAFIQAYVFTMLSALFIGMAVVEHEHHHDDQHEAGAVPGIAAAVAGRDGADTNVEPEPVIA